MSLTTRAHKGNYMLEAPFVYGEKYGGSDKVTYTTRDGRLHCDFCGSLHPSEVAKLLAAGATMSPADRKYGWPHKFYLDNPWGKFYTAHLIDATPEERDAIERAMGLSIDYDPDTQQVSWRSYAKREPIQPENDRADTT